MNQEVSEKLKATVGSYCVVTLRGEKQRGMVEEVMKTVEGDNIEQTIVLSEFKIRLDSGDEMIVPGWMIADIEPVSVGLSSTGNPVR